MKSYITMEVFFLHLLLWTLLYSSGLQSAEPRLECGHDSLYTLEDVLHRALEHSPSLLQASLAIESSLVGYEVARDEFRLHICPNAQAGMIGGGKAGEGPSLGGGIEVIQCLPIGTRVSLRPNITRANRIFTSDARARITQPLLRGSSPTYNLSNVRSAEFAWRSAIRSYYLAQVDVVLTTIRAVYEVCKSSKEWEFNQVLFQQIEGLLATCQLKKEMGIAQQNDLYHMEVERQKALQKLQESEGAKIRSLDAMRELLGLPIQAPLTISALESWEKVNLDWESASEFALAHRVEMEQVHDEMNEALRLVAVSRHRNLPSVNLVVDYANCGNNQALIKSCVQDRISTWNIGVTSSTELTGSTNRFSVQQSLLGLRRAEFACERKRKEITQEVRNRILELKRLEEKMRLEEDKCAAAAGRLELVKLRYQHQMANSLDLYHAMRNLYTVQMDQFQCMLEHIIGEYRLDGALGILANLEAIHSPINP